MPVITFSNNMKTINTQLLKTFRAVATTGSMTQAAALLNLSQGAISQQIRKLEDLFGCRLLIRQKAGLALTIAGEKLLGKAQKFLNLNEEIWRDMTDQNFKGRINLGVPLDLVATALPNALRLFADHHPDVDVNLVCAPTLELKQLLQGGDIDLSLLEEHENSLTGEALFRDQLVWMGAKGGLAKRKTPLPLSIASNECVFRLPTTTALDQAGKRWKRLYESNNIDAVQAIIRMDLAVGVFLKSLVPSTLETIPFGEDFPRLPEFHITLAIGQTESRDLAQILAGFISRHFHYKAAA